MLAATDVGHFGLWNESGNKQPGKWSQADAAAAETTQLTWWHSMSGAGEKAINQTRFRF